MNVAVTREATEVCETRMTTPASKWTYRGGVKRAFDVVGASAILLFAAPVLVGIGVIVRASGGSVFYAHPRVGKAGNEFPCLKFRTMVPDSERRLSDLLSRDPVARMEWAASRKLKRDPRVTRVGRFLRATSLDEVPQLLNVIRGDMSLVGPRPVVRAELDEHYGSEAAARYASVRPGITGLWQVSGRSDTTYRERVSLDMDYAKRVSFGGDLAILCRTISAVVRRQGAY